MLDKNINMIIMLESKMFISKSFKIIENKIRKIGNDKIVSLDILLPVKEGDPNIGWIHTDKPSKRIIIKLKLIFFLWKLYFKIVKINKLIKIKLATIILDITIKRSRKVYLNENRTDIEGKRYEVVLPKKLPEKYFNIKNKKKLINIPLINILILIFLLKIIL